MTITAPAPRPLRKPRLRRLLARVVAPPLFDFWAGHVHPLWTWERPLARLVKRRAASSDAVTLLLQPNRHWVGAAPGQHVNLGAEIDGMRVTRSYSLSAPRRADGRIEITVKSIAGGRLSAHLSNAARIGDVFDLGPAFGAMTLPASDREPLLFLAAGSGITPIMALTRELAARGMPAPLTLAYWTRTRAERCFAEELRALAATHPNLTLRLMLTREPANAPDEGRGRIDRAQLERDVPDLAQRRVYACGPGGFVEQARAVVDQRAHAFVAEAFTPPPLLAEPHGSARVALLRSGRVLTVPRGESLLAALEAAGVKPASGCRMGICNTCACGKRTGATRHLHTGAVVVEPVSALRLCVNAAAGDLELEL